MKLFLFPQIPGNSSGYQIAVKNDLNKVDIHSDDFVVFVTESPDVLSIKCQYATIKRKKKVSLWSIKQFILFRPHSEISIQSLKEALKDRQFDEIFCGDTIFYRGAKNLFPRSILSVRFHNLFILARNRNKISKYKLNWFHRYLNYSFSRLENKILCDKQCQPILITREEFLYSKLLYRNDRIKLWEIPLEVLPNIDIKRQSIKKFIWFGGISPQKKDGIEYFIKNIWPELLQFDNSLEFHLYGKNTEIFHDRNFNIYGHGFYKKSDIPFKNESIYINPDLLGGGVKIKVSHLAKSSAFLITTPSGIEGWQDFSSNPNFLIAPIEKWVKILLDYLSNSNINK